MATRQGKNRVEFYSPGYSENGDYLFIKDGHYNGENHPLLIKSDEGGLLPLGRQEVSMLRDFLNEHFPEPDTPPDEDGPKLEGESENESPRLSEFLFAIEINYRVTLYLTVDWDEGGTSWVLWNSAKSKLFYISDTEARTLIEGLKYFSG